MHKKIFTLTFLISLSVIPLTVKSQYWSGVVTSKFASSGQVLWECYGGSNNYGRNLVQEINTDVNSNVYIAGKTTAGLWFNNIGIGGELFVAKYSPTGELLWAKPIDGATMTVNGIATDSEENCYVVGWFDSLIISDTIRLYCKNHSEIFIIKYDKYGETIWVKSSLGRDYRLRAESISINETNNHLYITGWEDDDYPHGNNTKLIVAKYNLTNGELLREVEIYKNQDTPHGSGNIGNCIINNGSSIFICGTLSIASGKQANFYVAKLDTGLNIIWDKGPTETASQNIAYDIALDDENNVYVTGFYKDSITIGNQLLPDLSYQDIFISKFSEEGNFIWAKNAGSVVAGYLGHDVGYSICFDYNNSIYVSGYVGKDAVFSPTIQTQHAGPFIAKLDKNGDYEYVNSYYTGYDDNDERGTGHVACASNGDFYFSTSFEDSITLNIESYKKRLTNAFFELYPNPAKETIYLSYNPNQTVNSARILNLSGQTVFKARGIKNKQLNIGFLTSGIYLVELEFSDNSRATQKLIVTKE
ncbi:MAG: T9SS type A sorting domain-containing protein [Mariniphaga sp.]|nr:T9SS type A sorting domain-containing protein [Mariniphaga sp.]